jgi:type II secretory pathway pseudopilin PulG
MFIANKFKWEGQAMKTNYLHKIVGGLILGLSLLGIGMVSSTTTQAQYRVWQNQDQRQRELERQRQRELRRQREQQARQGGWYDQYGNYHPATTQSGWYDQYGVFHPTNQNGNYNNGYYRGRSSDGYPNLGGSFDLRQTALNAGFADGAKAGREDRNRRRGYNVQGHSEYQRATRDYNSGRGDRYLYQQYYRVAFEHGYADGYSGY